MYIENIIDNINRLKPMTSSILEIPEKHLRFSPNHNIAPNANVVVHFKKSRISLK